MESLTLYVLRSFPQGTGLAGAVENSTFTTLSQLSAASGVDPQAIAEFVARLAAATPSGYEACCLG